MKAISNRGQDRQDIQSIVSINRELDKARIRYWVTQYGELKDEPELWREIEPLLKEESA